MSKESFFYYLGWSGKKPYKADDLQLRKRIHWKKSVIWDRFETFLNKILSCLWSGLKVKRIYGSMSGTYKVNITQNLQIFDKFAIY
jgi:hypothetical protein